MAFSPLPDQDLLRQVLDYEPESGRLLWRERAPSLFKVQSKQAVASWNGTFAGTPALQSLCNAGYRRGLLLGQMVYAHRIVWKLCYGFDPCAVDHINGDRSDNRLSNLRQVTLSQNAKNRILRVTSTSGWAGVHKLKGEHKWQAGITSEGKRIHLGTFNSLDDAIAARRTAERKFGYTGRGSSRQISE